MQALLKQFEAELIEVAQRDSLQWPVGEATKGTEPVADAAADVAVMTLARQAGIDDASINRAAARVLNIETLDNLASRPVSAEFLERISIRFARKHVMIGLASDGDSMPIAIANPLALEVLDVVGRYLKRAVHPMVADAEAIQALINTAYQQRSEEANQFIQTLDNDARFSLGDVSESNASPSREDLLDLATRAPVIKLVNLLLFEAVKQAASDVHIQPYDEKLVIRMRIDGVLFDAYDLPKAMQDEIISRVKVMGQMNIAEKRIAQDGRATVEVGDRLIDLRISSLPTSFGERIVIRLLDKSARLYTLSELGMPTGVFEQFRELISLEHGLILVTGPTGSGKSTTLYAALQALKSDEQNILTLEDPIEYQLPGISQTQVNFKKGMTFASGLRTVLRQDPDIIMVGEVRDHETAGMAIQSALTGHLVFSTLHTNDAASAMTRLLDLGVEPYLAASSVIGILAQRLVRCVCKDCAVSEPMSEEQIRRLGVEVSPALSNQHTGEWQTKRGKGCAACRHTGYRGRMGIFELLVITDPVRKAMKSNATASIIKEAALQGSSSVAFNTLRADGIEKITRGLTTVEEVLRVTMA